MSDSQLPRRIAVKFFVDSAAELPLEPFIELFHRLIQEQAVLGLLVDVADYAHVPDGPGIVLIGHDVDYSIDSTGGRTGLLTTRKHYATEADSLAEVLRDTLAKAVVAIRAIGNYGMSSLKFDTSRIEVQILDRLAVKEDGALDRLVAEVAPVLGEVFEKIGTEIAQGDSRKPPTLVVTAQQAADPEELCGRLGVSMPVPQREGDFDVDVQSLKELRDTGATFQLIDVREPDEYETCNLGGDLIPLGTLSDRIAGLDKAAHIIVHCKGGPRGAKATAALREAGFENAWNLKGGILAWIDEVDSSLTRY